ncbi:MAG: cyclase family protein, partial [bacterium]|nr:cyclase family protein [bacterium]
IAIPLVFNGPQPNTYNVPAAKSRAYEADGFVGDTRRGGGCNFETYEFTPHCVGTHTECVGHISYERIAIYKTLQAAFIPATLITVKPESSPDSESYDPPLNKEDKVITKQMLETALTDCETPFLEALIIRTLPNDDSKKSRRYMEHAPAFFTNEAMHYLTSLSIQHLLIDLPSVDRLFDEGKLSNHHIYWNVKQGTHDVDPANMSLKTITEMIYVPDGISDGKYLLNLQVPSFSTDAAPSRPLLFAFGDQGAFLKNRPLDP